MRDPYIILGVDRKADAAAIKSAYRTLAKRYHPDIAGANPTTQDRFQEISTAYDLLSNETKREKFDGGNGKSSTAKGARKSKASASTSSKTAPSRNGNGAKPDSSPPMSPPRQSFKTATRAAEAKRAAERHHQERPFGIDSVKGESPLDIGLNKADEIIGDIFSTLKSKAKPVDNKKGSDEHYMLPTTFEESARGGARRIKLPNGQKLDVKIPAGICDGQQIRLKNQGQAGEGEGIAGDALIKISIELHQHFRRVGDDVVLDLPVTVDEAVLGARIMVPTVDGPTAVTVPAGSNADNAITLEGLGFPKDSDGPTRPLGNQSVVLKIVLPPSSNKSFTQFVKKWAGKNPYNVRSEFDI